MKNLILLILTLISLQAAAQGYKIRCLVNGKDVKNRAYLKPGDTFKLVIESTDPKETWVFRQIGLKCAGSETVTQKGKIQESVTRTVARAIPEGRFRNRTEFTMRGDEFCPGAKGTVSVKAIGVLGNEAKMVNLALYDYIMVPSK